MRLRYIEHQRDAPAGLLDEWARERGYETVVTRPADGEPLPAPDRGELIVSLGSDCSIARRDASWIEAELEYLREAHDAGCALLGICFGGQALAAALGGSVERAPRVAIEWSELDGGDHDLVSRGPWFRWHEDVFTAPGSARLLAVADGVQMAFECGASVGLQFHPEVTAPIADAWLAAAGRQLAAEAHDLGRVRERILAGMPGSRDRAFALFDSLAERWRAAGLV